MRHEATRNGDRALTGQTRDNVTALHRPYTCETLRESVRYGP